MKQPVVVIRGLRYADFGDRVYIPLVDSRADVQAWTTRRSVVESARYTGANRRVERVLERIQ
jgi:hypothetical protein